MALQFVSSERGKPHLLFDGYRFILDKDHNGKRSWECTERRRWKCRSRIHTIGDQVLKYQGDHNHTPSPEMIEAKKIVSKIKQTSVLSTESPQSLIAHETRELGPAAAAKLPQISSMKRLVQRQRQTVNYPHSLPTSLMDLNIPDKYKVTTRNENFLLYDSGPSRHRMIIFGTQKNLDFMSTCEHWFADGTFKVAPQLFSQIYTIHGVKYSSVIPTLFVLLTQKSEDTYTTMLQVVKNLCPAANPTSVLTDFELAAMNAFRNVFPNITLSGCFFHFGQCLWRRVQRFSDMVTSYKEDAEFALKIRMLSALAFVPPSDVVTAFETLTDEPFYSSTTSLTELVNYFEDTWIGRAQRRRIRRPPLYPAERWNCYQRVLDDLSKTNNSVEGWHRGFHSLVSGDNPTIWRLIEALQSQQSLNEIRIEQYVSGQPTPLQRQPYRNSLARLKSVVEDYNNRPILEYLRGVAHSIQLNV